MVFRYDVDQDKIYDEKLIEHISDEIYKSKQKFQFLTARDNKINSSPTKSISTKFDKPRQIKRVESMQNVQDYLVPKHKTTLSTSRNSHNMQSIDGDSSLRGNKLQIQIDNLPSSFTINMFNNIPENETPNNKDDIETKPKFKSKKEEN